MSLAQKSITNLSILNDETFSHGIEFLCLHDTDLNRIVQTYGEPPIWTRASGFPTLLYIILEQQVSLASAKAIYGRLLKATKTLTPRRFLRLDDETLRAIGFSRQKTLYAREVARAIVERRLDLDALEKMDDAAVKVELTKIKGIGNWTADIYLLMALRRPDAFPTGDLGLIIGAQEVKRLPSRPTHEELLSIGESWRPFRAVATRLLWHYYLNRKS